MKKLAVYVTVLVAFLCLGACSTQAPTLVPTPKALPVMASPATPENTINPSTSPRKAEIDKSLIETVHWKKRTIYTDEEWYKRGYIFSNGKYSFYLTNGYGKDTYMLNIAGSNHFNDICPLDFGKSSPPEYYSLISDMAGDNIELRYYPATEKIKIIDGGHRFDNDNYSGDYNCLTQKIAKYPKGAIIFTCRGNVDFHSVVMLPYVDGSADFVVDEKDTYHCDGYTKSDIPLYTRIYKFSKEGKEAVFSLVPGGDTEATAIDISGKLFEYNEDLYRMYRADLTKY